MVSSPRYINLVALLFVIGCGPSAAPDHNVCKVDPVHELKLKSIVVNADSLAKTGNYSASDSLANLALSQCDDCAYRYWKYRLHYRLCMNAWRNDQPEKAIEKCLHWSRESASTPDSLSGYYNSLLGWFYFEQSNFEAARPCLEQAAALLEASGQTAKLPGVYNNLAPCLIRLGDYEAADFYLRAAIRLNTTRKDSNRLAINYHNLGRNYNAQDKSMEAIDCFNRAAAFATIKDADYYEGICKAHYSAKNYREAWNSILKYQTALGPNADPSAKALGLQWKGLIESAQGNNSKAIVNFIHALQAWKSAADTAHYDFGKTKIFLGDAFRASKNPIQALSAYQSALQGFIPGFVQISPEYNPEYSELPNEIWVMETILNKALAWEQLFELSQDSMHLKLALGCASLSTKAFCKMKGLYLEDASKLHLDRYGYRRFFEKSIEIAHKLAKKTHNQAYLKEAFLLAQRSKAGILRNAIQERSALLNASLAQDSILAIDQLQRAIALIDRHISLSNDSLKTDSLNHARFLLKRKWIKMQNWAFSRLNGQRPDPLKECSVSEIQSILPADALLIEYFLGEKHCYIYAISARNFCSFAMTLPANFEHRAHELLRALTDRQWIQDSSKQAEEVYLKQASFFFEVLLSNALKESPDCNRLFIVTDGILSRLPFSCLLTQPFQEGWHSNHLPLLLKNCATSYLYSSALLPNSFDVGQSKYRFGGFGANYRDPFTLNFKEIPSDSSINAQLNWQIRGDLRPLDHADEEVDSIVAVAGGRKWLNQNASKTNFLKEGPNCGILHLALHTVESPPKDLSGFYLMFSKASVQEDNYLSAYELSALKLNAKLVVISACNSGLGKFQQGEGMANLGRAFALSGCPSIVVNLWQAHDKTSKTMMIAFYQKLKTQMPKDLAMQKAQLYYLQQTVSERATPFFWANFVVMGDVSPLNLDGTTPWWYFFRSKH